MTCSIGRANETSENQFSAIIPEAIVVAAVVVVIVVVVVVE